MTPAERAARVQRIANELREQSDGVYTYAIGAIGEFAADYRTDAEVAAGVRDVLAALEIVTKPANGAGR